MSASSQCSSTPSLYLLSHFPLTAMSASSSSLPNSSHSSTLRDLAQSIFSYNSNVMLAAIISLLLVVLFVLLLHAYAKWFFPQARHRRRQRSVRVSYILGPSRLSGHFDSVSFGLGVPTKGLHPSVISAIPLFIYESEKQRKAGVECVICLSEFEDGEIGRSLPKCGHRFHLECIDMWLNSHTNCPLCRVPVACEAVNSETKPTEETVESGRPDRENGVEIVIEEQNCENESHQRLNGQSLAAAAASSSSSSSFDPSLTSFGASLKRILSRNKSEGRIFPSSNGIELDA